MFKCPLLSATPAVQRSEGINKQLNVFPYPPFITKNQSAYFESKHVINVLKPVSSLMRNIMPNT